MSSKSATRLTWVPVLVLLGLAASTPASAIDLCEVKDDGTGTVTLPPPGCAYLSPQQVHMIIDGLPPGTTIELDPIHSAFFCRSLGTTGPCVVEPGGALGGEREVFDSYLVFELKGTGDLAGFHRILSLPAAAETHTAPRTPGDPVQSFDTDMFQMQGALSGDPDFAQLQVIAGTNFGLPSPGHTTLTDLGNGSFHVDSFFDIAYQIDFVGAPGSILEGLSGSTQGTTRMEAAGTKNPCSAVDDGTGTVVLPPKGCDFVSPDQVAMISSGLPAGTTIELASRSADFVCTAASGVCGQPGGGLGGEVEQFDSTFVFELEGTGALSDFRRTLRLPASLETNTGPRTPGDPVQSFDTELVSLLATLPPGDPDFASLTIVAGSDNMLPSPGHTILTDLGDGSFHVDSFFDVAYEIDFAGAPGGALDGLRGTTNGAIRMETRSARMDATERDNGTGTTTLPPPGSQYVSPNDVAMILDGLPPGTTIELDPSDRLFFCQDPQCETPNPTGAGQDQGFDSSLSLKLRGTGALVGFQRALTVPTVVQTHTGPRNPGDAVQRFDTEMVNLQGILLGDPDFDFLQITAGSANQLPSPGHTTLTELGNGNFQVDSFFDVTYQITFIGAPGGALDGFSGTTQGSFRVSASDDPFVPTRAITIVQTSDPPDPVDFPFTGDLGSFALDTDVSDASLPSQRTFDNLSLGPYAVTDSLPAGWVLLGIGCVDPDGGTTVDPGAGQAMVDLDLGEDITCTFRAALESSVIFADGFESGDMIAWSNSVP